MGADGCIFPSHITFGAAKILGNPDLYGWRKEAGDTLITQGFSNFKDLYNKRPNAMQWDIKQLQNEQKLLQPVHEKYLSNETSFKLTISLMTDVDILNYESRIKYGCKLMGYTEQQGCKP